MNRSSLHFFSANFLLLWLTSCSIEKPLTEGRHEHQNPLDAGSEEEDGETADTITNLEADTSCVSELTAHGGVYRNKSGQEVDPFQLFWNRAINSIRFRLLCKQDGTKYSTLTT